MVFNYTVNEEGETFTDLFMKSRTLSENAASLLCRAKDSVLSLYEVSSVAKDKRVLLKDVLLDREVDLRDKAMTQGLKKGDLFATRILNLDGKDVMGGCVYPYLSAQKQQILVYIARQFKRYTKNVKHDGTMKEYLKDYGDVFNLIWMNFIIEPPEEKS